MSGPCEQHTRPAYWALYLFVAVMIVVLFAAVALTSAAWHRPIELGWIAALALGISIWRRQNRTAEIAQAIREGERWHDSPEQRHVDEIGIDREE